MDDPRPQLVLIVLEGEFHKEVRRILSAIRQLFDCRVGIGRGGVSFYPIWIIIDGWWRGGLVRMHMGRVVN